MKKVITLNNLIITIITIVMLIVALSTATFAWFSANNIVNLSNMTFTVQTDQGAGDLRLSWLDWGDDFRTNPTAQKYLIYSVSGNRIGGGVGQGSAGSTLPGMPNIKPYIGMSKEEFSNSLHTGLVAHTIVNGEVEERFRENGRRIRPVYIYGYHVDEDESTMSNTLYLYNLNESSDLEVTISLDYVYNSKRDDDNDSLKTFRFVVFVDGKLVGFIGNQRKVYYGNIVKGEVFDGSTWISDDFKYDNTSVQLDGRPVKVEEYHGFNGSLHSNFSFRVKDKVSVEILGYFDGANIATLTASLFEVEKLQFHGRYVEKE